MLARREHTREELRRKLKHRGFDPSAIESVLSGLVDAGLQSDERYVEAYMASRISKGFGPVRIMSELRQRGVDAAFVAACVDTQSADWRHGAQSACAKRFGTDAPNNRREQLKQMRFLQYRGFTSEQIRSVFAQTD